MPGMFEAGVCSDTQSCPTLCNPMYCSLPDFSFHGILQARILDWVSIPPPGELPNSEIESMSPVSPAPLEGRFFTTTTNQEALEGSVARSESTRTY